MNQKVYNCVTGTIFALIALLHLFRVWYGWKAVIGGWPVPMWLSWTAFLLGAYLAYEGLKRCKK